MEESEKELENVVYLNQIFSQIRKRVTNTTTHARSPCQKWKTAILRNVQYLKIGQSGQAVQIPVAEVSERKLEIVLKCLKMDEVLEAYSMIIRVWDL